MQESDSNTVIRWYKLCIGMYKIKIITKYLVEHHSEDVCESRSDGEALPQYCRSWVQILSKSRTFSCCLFLLSSVISGVFKYFLEAGSF